ncbi:IcmL-like protein [Legionella busanensis]|uniref:IcmL-like protein n=1 Tax=Legionella busanensis TaxID=190655 RepID=A0A378JVH5_9GAMM|nr:DotI/IcmL family type IV secretion protein [Legionella busanensis]STX52202.1 IcmL-like protein [Legionella busanensis]
MKKTMLFSSLLTVLSGSIYAEKSDSLVNATLDNYTKAASSSVSQQIQLAKADTFKVAAATTAPSSTTTTTTQEVVVPTTTQPATVTTQPATVTTQPATVTTQPATVTTQPTTVTTQPATVTTPSTTTTVITNPAPTTTTTATVPASSTGTTSMAQPMNCTYHIPPETTHIEHAIIMQWANNATRQSFDFDHVNIAQQLTNLRPCYTEQGWQSFNEALNKSGNLSAIRTQKLMVASTVDGNIAVTDLKENQWRASVPLQVIYQNEKQKLTQLLTVDLIIGRKVTGDLGIMQMIASPRQAVTTTAPAATTTTTTIKKPTTVIIKQPASGNP